VELTQAIHDLLEAARTAREHAYCPYSGYAVGAAVMLLDGSIATGCNVENASFGLSICAERNAIAAATLVGETPHLVAVALVASPRETSVFEDAAVMPCGACLQVISEFASPACAIICARPDAFDQARIYTLSDLLPHRFGNG
jgi:cytidine deaminase